jgi:hypothetical protein
MLFMLGALPYSHLYYSNRQLPNNMIKLIMMSRKYKMKPESYCSKPKSRCFLPFFQEVMNMEYGQDPSYGHLQFLLTVPLLEQGLVPSKCVFNRLIAEDILIRSDSFRSLDYDDSEAIEQK